MNPLKKQIKEICSMKSIFPLTELRKGSKEKVAFAFLGIKIHTGIAHGRERAVETGIYSL